MFSAITHTLAGDDWSTLRDAKDGSAGVNEGGSGAFVVEALARWIRRLPAAAAGNAAPTAWRLIAAPARAHGQSVQLAAAGELSHMAAGLAPAAATAPDNTPFRGLLVATAPYRTGLPAGR